MYIYKFNASRMCSSITRYREIQGTYCRQKPQLEAAVLDFVNDAALAGKSILSQQAEIIDSNEDLKDQLAQSIRWLLELTSRDNINIQSAMASFPLKRARNN